MGREWTAEDDNLLRELAATQSYATISGALGRSKSAVHHRAVVIGITEENRRGEHHKREKTTALQAAAAGVLLDAGFTWREVQTLLALQIGKQGIGAIGRGDTWGHVSGLNNERALLGEDGGK